MYGRNGVPSARVQLNPNGGQPEINTPPTTRAILFSSLKSTPIFSKLRQALNARITPQALFIKGEPLEMRYQRQSSYSDRANQEIRIIELPKRYMNNGQN